MQMYQVDAFTDELFGGNPAAIVPLDRWIDDALMQKIALENNLSETAFVGFDKEGIRIRWFTPTTEVDLCGHATLAAGKVWLEKMEPRADEVVFQSRSGPLTVKRHEQGFEMDFPNVQPTAVTDQAKLSAVSQALGVSVQSLWLNDDWNAVLNNADQVLAVQPDMAKVAALGQRGVTISAVAEGGAEDYVARCFFPQSGIDEDPATGSAHCGLAPLWGEKLAKTVLQAKQVSTRGANLECEVVDDRVKLRGNAVLYMTARLAIGSATGSVR